MKQMEMSASTSEDTESEHPSRSNVSSSHDQINSPSNAIESINLNDGEVEVLMTSNVGSLSPRGQTDDDSDVEITHCSIKVFVCVCECVCAAHATLQNFPTLINSSTYLTFQEPSTWMQVRSYYRKWQRMHPYADEVNLLYFFSSST